MNLFNQVDKNRGVYMALYLFDKERQMYYQQCNSVIALNHQEIIEFHSYIEHYNLVPLLNSNMSQRFFLANGTPIMTSIINYDEFANFNEFLSENDRKPVTDTYAYWNLLQAEVAKANNPNQHLVVDFNFIKKCS
ncbi:TPA: hypothetical protein ACX6RO_001809 [Photobacterium damselae]